MPKKKGKVKKIGLRLTRTRLETIIRESLNGKLTRDCKIMWSDGRYYCPPMSDINMMIRKNKLDRKKYTRGIFDCDDFALSLKYFFIKHAYKNKITRRPPHCVGILWGNIQGKGRHVINIVVNDQKEVLFIEPQHDDIFKPGKKDKEIEFLYF